MRKFSFLIATWMVCFIVGLGAAHAVNPDEVLSDPVLEQRARNLSSHLRCLVCQNQSIDDSDAQLARDLRLLVREKLVEGLDDDEVLEYLVDRYGEFVLLRPRFGGHTLVLWLLPLAVLVFGVFMARGVFRKNREADTGPIELSEEEQRKLEEIVGQK